MTIVDVMRYTILFLSVPAAVWDVAERRIPNFISLPALALALAVFVLAGEDNALGLLAVPVVFASWTAGWVGGGDAKLLMALALAFGPWPVVIATAASGLAALLARRSMPGAVFALPAVLIWILFF